MKIIILNLKKDLHRKKNMLKKVGGYNPIFINSICGNELPEKELEAVLGNISNLTNGKIKSLTPGEIGCSLSHLRAYEYICENKIPFAIILEDDVKLTVEAGMFLDEINKHGLPTEQELILLGYSSNAKDYDRKASLSLFRRIKIGNFQLGIPIERLYGSYAYIITEKGANKLLEYGYPLRMQADVLLSNCKNAGIKNFVVSKPIIIPDEDNNWSSIGGRIDFYLSEQIAQKRNVLIEFVPQKIRNRMGKLLLALSNYSKNGRKFSPNPWKYYLDNF